MSFAVLLHGCVSPVYDVLTYGAFALPVFPPDPGVLLGECLFVPILPQGKVARRISMAFRLDIQGSVLGFNDSGSYNWIYCMSLEEFLYGGFTFGIRRLIRMVSSIKPCLLQVDVVEIFETGRIIQWCTAFIKYLGSATIKIVSSIIFDAPRPISALASASMIATISVMRTEHDLFACVLVFTVVCD